MTIEIEKKEKGLSRRDIITGAGKIAAGAAILSMGGIGKVTEAEAYSYASDFKYKKLNPREVGQISYENYFKRWCASSVIAGFVAPLKKKVGGAWKGFPIDAYRAFHGGLAGWGALCGTLSGAAVIIGLSTRDTDTAESMINDLAFYYSYTELPSFTPAKILKAKIHNMTMAGTPVCHISVGKWMRSEGVAFLSNERSERCARLAANIAMEAVGMLNEYAANGKYSPKHQLLFNLAANGITSQNNCSDCHGQNPPSPNDTHQTLKK